MNIQDVMTLASQKAWSPFSSSQSTFGTPANATMLAEFNSGMAYLTNRSDFPFQKDTTKCSTQANESTCFLDVGVVEKIYIDGGTDYLERIEKNVFLDNQKGEPKQYYLDYSSNSLILHLYPIPDKSYDVNVEYQVSKFVADANSEAKDRFTVATDTLNIPEQLQNLYWECLILRAMQTGIKDNTDENYQPIKEEFGDLWRLFVQKTNPNIGSKRNVI